MPRSLQDAYCSLLCAFGAVEPSNRRLDLDGMASEAEATATAEGAAPPFGSIEAICLTFILVIMYRLWTLKTDNDARRKAKAALA